MNGSAIRAITVAIVWLSSVITAFLQVNIQPTLAPAITAERAEWYRNGDPVPYAGSIYYTAGPEIHFIASEMVRSGSYQGIPIYTRTTIEPYSVIFVPLAGGLMQPYERRRAGELAGTDRSSAPYLPVSSSAGAVSMMGTPAPQAATGSIPQNVGQVGTAGTFARRHR